MFQCLIFNIDDHPPNHAFTAEDEDWGLSPGYDLTPSPVVGQDHRDLAMECGDLGRFANASNILSQHARFLLDKDEAENILSDRVARRAHRSTGQSRRLTQLEFNGNCLGILEV